MTSDSRQIRDFILRNFLFSEDDGSLSDTGSLIASGTIDSTGVLELIMFIEETFNIKVADEEMIPDNLDSIDKIVGYVRRKRSGDV
jgi:acyl carrier protein